MDQNKACRDDRNTKKGHHPKHKTTLTQAATARGLLKMSFSF